MSNTSFHALGPESALERLESRLEGLSDAEAKKRLEQHGPNQLVQQTRRSTWSVFLEQFKDILILLLLGATVVSLGLGEYLDAIAMFSIVLLSALLGFIQEFRAEQAVAALQQLSAPHAQVLRDGRREEIEATELVPGDILLLEAGNLCPADARLLQAEQLKVDEASLTGESMRVSKHTDVLPEDCIASDQRNTVFMGTFVVHGTAKAVVTQTGMQTLLGSIATSLHHTENPPTPLQVKFQRIARRIAIAILLIIVVVFISTFLNKPGNLSWTEYASHMLIFSLSLAVAAVPSSLPAIVTIGLAFGTKALAQRKMLIKTLPAAESLGSVTYICSDKTGTLTKNEMTVKQLYTDEGFVGVAGIGYTPEGHLERDGEKIEPFGPFEELMSVAALCNNAQLVKNDGQYGILGDPTEGALRVLVEKTLPSDVFDAFERIREFPFDSERKCMSVVVRSPEGEHISYVKGAPDVLLARCSQILTADGIQPIDEPYTQRIQDANQKMASQALRVLALAYLPLEGAFSTEEDAEPPEQDLIFVGLTGMLDPPRDEVKDAIRETQTAGIKVMLITGDHAITAQAIAEDLGLYSPGDQILTGQQLEELSDEALKPKLEKIRIIARALPSHKTRMVTLLQEKGHIVAMTGDGVNDAPALKKADIGIAMGQTGTDVAKEASQAIMLDDNFATIVGAVEEGRNIYDKIIKSMRYLLSCNAGEIVTVFFAVLVGLPLPLLPLQILLMNLVTDGLPALALGFEPSDKSVMKRPPRSPDYNPLRFQAFILLLIFGVIMGSGTLWLYTQYVQTDLVKAQTVAFTTLVMFEMFAVFGARSLVPFGRLNPFSNRWLLPAVTSSILLQFAVIYLAPLQKIFGTKALAFDDWLWILLVSSLGFLLMEVGKLVFSEPSTKEA